MRWRGWMSLSASGSWRRGSPAAGTRPAARSTFEWALDRQFLIQRTEVPVPEAPDA